METTNRASSLDRLSKALNPKGKQTDEHVWGTVESVNADGSYQVRINSAGAATRCVACCKADAGDRVLVAILADGKCATVGRLGGEIGGGGGGASYIAGEGISIKNGIISAEVTQAELDNHIESATPKVLYSNESGTTGTVTLSQSAADFTFLEVQYTDGSRTITRRVYKPNGKTMSLDRSVYGGGTFYTGAMIVAISGTSITRVTANCGIASFTADGLAVSPEAGHLPITTVIGFA